MRVNWKYGLAALAVLAAIVASTMALRNHGTQRPLVDVTVPALSDQASAGEELFNQNCASCHGKNAAGSNTGPPLVHIIYEPSHHSDASFQRAARVGTRAHHWKFGDMPPVDGIKPEQVTTITAYVRELQRANGIR